MKTKTKKNNTIIRFFRKYIPFSKSGVLDLLAYKASLYSWFLISSLSLICTFFLWVAIYRNSPNDSINGYTLNEMLTYVCFINVGGFGVSAGDTHGKISDEIKDGTIAMQLIKPISYRLRFVFITLGNYFGTMLIFTLPLLTVVSIVLHFTGIFVITSIWQFLLRTILFIVAQIIGCILYDGINYFFGLCTFYTMASFGMFQLKEVIIRFLSGAMIPLAFFPSWIKNIVSYSPFASIGQNPTLILLGKLDYPEIFINLLIALGWIVCLELLNALFYSRAIKNITIQGG